MTLDQFLSIYWMLQPRTVKWLTLNPNELEAFRKRFEENPHPHLRDLCWTERQAITNVEQGIQPQDVETLRQEALTAAGSKLAECLYVTMRRPGFMRRLLSNDTDVTVREYTETEAVQVRRLMRKMHIPWHQQTERFRSVLHLMRDSK